MHGDAFACFIRQCAGDLLAYLAGPVDEGFKRDGFTRGTDAFEHRRKNMFAVQQHLEAVSGQ